MPKLYFRSFCFCLLLVSSKAFGGVVDQTVELDRVKQDLEKLHVHSAYWQYGWTSFFTGSLALQARTLAADSTSNEQKFDARVSVVTSGSGLFSTLFNPMPAAFLREFHQSPEVTPSQREVKVALGQRILDDTRLEINRRRSVGFQVFVLTEQVLAAGAIAWIDKRPQVAGRRFLWGMLTSELFIFTTPWKSSHHDTTQVSWHILPDRISFDLKF
ncbi:MAG TPA: hypothetical protein VE954_36790 [Oligoflexus sp.]|uniref:hypothetical protein n=1 Tax=Oligoflexus sp. TaxID=1971216 RepID=UPI002D41F029|nr:hypothetical protein [Oligoflexus sp.]HYX38695.1 hypothetical protein [Oligoflexus sp.]